MGGGFGRINVASEIEVYCGYARFRKLRKLSLGSWSAWGFLSDLTALFGLVDLNTILLPVVPGFSAGNAHFWEEFLRLSANVKRADDWDVEPN